MKTKPKSERVVCRTPTPGKKPTRIEAWKYDLVRKAILEMVPRSGEGVAFADLPKLVAAALTADERRRLGSIPWYTTTVKLDMEVRRELQRLKGVSPQRLLRT